jgi:hypothetical protein
MLLLTLLSLAVFFVWQQSRGFLLLKTASDYYIRRVFVFRKTPSGPSFGGADLPLKATKQRFDC